MPNQWRPWGTRCGYTVLAVLQLYPAALAAQDEKSVLQRVNQLLEAGRLSESQVWPGFRIPTEIVLCGRTGSTLVRLERGVAAPAVTGEVEEVSPNAYLLPSPPPGLERVCFDLEYSIGGTDVIAVPLISAVYTIGDPVLANLVQFYHEAFHRYQEFHFEPTRGSDLQPLQEVRAPVAVLNSSGFARLARQERDELMRALNEPDRESKRAAVGRYLRLRERRLAGVPEIMEAEAHHERKEGIAHLVGLEIAFQVVAKGKGAVRGAILDHLEKTPAFLGDDYMAHPYRRWHVYGTGAALALLLTDFGVPWRERVGAGETPYSLIVTEVADRATEAAHGGGQSSRDALKGSFVGG